MSAIDVSPILSSIDFSSAASAVVFIFAAVALVLGALTGGRAILAAIAMHRKAVDEAAFQAWARERRQIQEDQRSNNVY